MRTSFWVLLLAALGLGGCVTPYVEGEPVVHAAAAAGGATYMGRTLSDWAGTVTQGDSQTRSQAARALAAIGPASLAYATEWLGSEDPGVRLTGVEVIRLLGPEAVSAAPALPAVLRDERPEVRAAAVQAIHAVEPTDETLMEDVGRLLQDDSWFVRYHASRALGELGLLGRGFLPDLRHLEHNDPDIRVRRESEQAVDVIEAAVVAHMKRR